MEERIRYMPFGRLSHIQLDKCETINYEVEDWKELIKYWNIKLG
jgi:hypothetical protein